ncbi:MAG: hypothetical protein Q4G40_08770, partial [Brachybacterium sp.]|nr:hypothetical protein [Brachybacterium sp.]
MPPRRHLLRGAGVIASAGVLGAGGWSVVTGRRPAARTAQIPLYSETVAVGPDGRRTLVHADSLDSLIPGTRLLSGAEDTPPARRWAEMTAQAAAWLDRVPERRRGLAADALADLWVLLDDLPGPVAAWTPYWRYIWPRDGAFCAAALARIGCADQAARILGHMATLQGEDGWFEARYVPGTAETPDDRRRQFDGTGLLLWATATTLEALPDEARRQAGERLAPMIERSRAALEDATKQGHRLPPVSPDYWEVREHRVTLGIAAATMVGLRAAERIGDLRGIPVDGDIAERFAGVLRSTFGARGFQRYRRSGGADSARAFFDACDAPGIVTLPQLQAVRAECARPGGGIAPGASWRDDGISWTPSTTLLGLA